MAVTKIRDNGWRQGSILKRADCEAYLNKKDVVGIVITQACDLVHHSYEGEPSVEIIMGRVVDQPDAQLKYGKNPRKLHIQLDYQDDNPTYLEIVPQDKVITDRQWLEDITPATETYLLERELKVLTSWLAARYDRAALPDEFNNRLREISKKQDKFAKKVSEKVIALYVDIHPFSELGEDKTYTVTLIAVVPKNKQDELMEIEEAVKEFAKQMEKVGLKVTSKTMLETKAPYILVTDYKRLHLDHISLRADPPDPM